MTAGQVGAGTRGGVSSVARVLAAGLALLALAAPLAAAAEHPLDPLTAEEIAVAVDTLRRADLADEAALYPRLALEEPSKAEVLRWRPGDPFSRRAFATVLQDDRTFEARIDLGVPRVLAWTEVPGVHPSLLLSDEWTSAARIVHASRQWQDAVRARGVRDLQHVVCVPLPVGYMSPADAAGRLVKVICFDATGVSNYWARPIEGLVAVVDLATHRLVRLIDTGAVPVPRGPVEIGVSPGAASRERIEPPASVPGRVPTFRVDGHIVRWQNWQFHYRVDPRVGLVVSTVRYRDGSDERSVLYQGALAELFVPYMDPDESWYFRAYLDAGEQGVGKLAVSLEPGRDCPPQAVTFDAVMADDWGEPVVYERAVCLFEREAGEIAWRHSEAVDGHTESRRRTDLVLRQVSAIGNYDYVFDWAFRQDGSIEVSVGATGLPQVKAVARVSADAAVQEGASGRLVAGHTLAVNHDHFFSFRLDLDVDGPRNSFAIDRLAVKRLSEEAARRSIWVVEPRIAETERDARLRIDMERPALWRVINPARLGALGYPTSYELRPDHNAMPLLDPDDPTRRRAGFTEYHLWVTPYAEDERYAAGRYPNQSPGGKGLSEWTRANRRIEATDIVLWYTLGFHHVARAEDWPVLPTLRHGFELRPFDFFERNPALDLPR